MIENNILFPDINHQDKPLEDAHYHHHKPDILLPPNPSFTIQEQFIQTTKRVNDTLNHILKLDSIIRKTVDDFIKNLTSDNTVFKDLCVNTYNQFAQTVQGEVNNFESEILNSFELYKTLVTNNWNEFVANFNEDYENKKSNLDEIIAEFKASQQKQYDDFMSDFALSNQEFIDNVNNKIEIFKSEFNGEFANFKDAIEDRLVKWNETNIESHNEFITRMENRATEFETGINNRLNDGLNGFSEENSQHKTYVENRLDGQDSVINDAVLHMKTNLSLVVDEVVHDMADKGEFQSIIEGSVFTAFGRRTASILSMQERANSVLNDTSDFKKTQAKHIFDLFTTKNDFKSDTQSKIIDFRGYTFNVYETLPVSSNTVLCNGIIKLGSTYEPANPSTVGFSIDNKKNITFKNMVIYYENQGDESTGNRQKQTGVFCYGSENITFENCEFYGFKTYSDPGYCDITSGIHLKNCKNVLIKGCKIHDITGVKYWDVQSTSASRGIYSDCSYNVKIDQCDIYNIISDDDGDGVQFIAETNDNVKAKHTNIIMNTSVKNCTKRCIKVQQNNVTINNCVFNNEYDENAISCTSAVISVYDFNCKILNNFIHHLGSLCIEVGVINPYTAQVENVVIANNKIKNFSTAYRGAINFSPCKIVQNVNIYGNNISNNSGTTESGVAICSPYRNVSINNNYIHGRCGVLVKYIEPNGTTPTNVFLNLSVCNNQGIINENIVYFEDNGIATGKGRQNNVICGNNFKLYKELSFTFTEGLNTVRVGGDNLVLLGSKFSTIKNNRLIYENMLYQDGKTYALTTMNPEEDTIPAINEGMYSEGYYTDGDIITLYYPTDNTNTTMNKRVFMVVNGGFMQIYEKIGE